MTESAPVARSAAGVAADLAAIREVSERRPSRPSPPEEWDRAALAHFADGLDAPLEPSRREELARQVAALEPWLQGPFLLGGDLVIGGEWRCDLRWSLLGEVVPASLTGRRVLDIGANAGYDAFTFRRRGAAEVVACEPHAFIAQAEFLESVYRTGVVLERISWQQLDPAVHGTFDLVHCNGVLYHEPSPVALLQTLRRLVREDGTLLLGTMMLADPELSQYLRFVPDSFLGDDSWWMVPGRLAVRWMLDAAGFRVEREFGEGELAGGEFPVVTAYFECRAKAPAPGLPGIHP